MVEPQTMFQKIWDRHVILKSGAEELLFVDFNVIHEGGTFMAFDQLRMDGRSVRRPERNIAISDHYVPTINRAAGVAGMTNPDLRRGVEMLAENAREFGIEFIDMHDRRHGIVHVVASELGIAQPGLLVTCCDSHTATNGALGTLAIPIGQSNQLRHVLSTQTLWQSRPKTMRIDIEGTLPDGVVAKDIVLGIISTVGIGGASGYAVEYAGSAIRALSMEGRMTLCNMSTEGGARIGMVAPDETTFAFLEGRARVPGNEAWDEAVAQWRSLPSDANARFDRVLSFAAEEMAPMVSWGTNPEESLPITGSVPRPADAGSDEACRRLERALAYMKLAPGMALTDIFIDRVFIGSCTNGRIEDLRAAAKVLAGRKAVVPAMVSPGSASVARQAVAEGLDEIFRGAGFEWRDSGCSMCAGSNGDLVAEGERCASTTNRNFEGRQGRGAMTHIMSPAMVAAAAVTGRLTDVRRLLAN